jgi:hypothetical protein
MASLPRIGLFYILYLYIIYFIHIMHIIRVLYVFYIGYIYIYIFHIRKMVVLYSQNDVFPKMPHNLPNGQYRKFLIFFIAFTPRRCEFFIFARHDSKIIYPCNSSTKSYLRLQNSKNVCKISNNL